MKKYLSVEKMISKSILITLLLNISLLNINSMQLLKYNCEKDTVEYPWLGEMLDLYGSYNYNAPDSVKELILFIEEIHQIYPDDIYYFEALKQITFPKLLKNNISFSKDNCTLTALLNDEILAESGVSLCCDSAEYYVNNVEWTFAQRKNSKKVCFFSESNKLILRNESLRDSFIKDRRKWMGKYKIVNPFTISEGSFNKFVLVEYHKGGRLHFLCSDHIDDLSDSFCKDLEEFLLDFCSRHKISKIIFLQELAEKQ